MGDEVIDISEHVGEFDVPLCPLCDDYLDGPTTNARAHGAHFMVHVGCLWDLRDSEGI